ncbi:DUF3618 domain-containing protein [Nocardioides pacificus]
MSGKHEGEPVEPGSPEAIEADIARQREQLADTVDALQRQLDFKTRAQDKLAELRRQATDADGKPKPAVSAGVAGAVVLLVGLIVLKRRRSRD